MLPNVSICMALEHSALDSNSAPHSVEVGRACNTGFMHADDLPMVDVALPLVHSEDLSQTSGFDPRSGEKSSLTLPSGVADAVQTMGLNHSIGSIRLLQARPAFSFATSPCPELRPPSSMQPTNLIGSHWCSICIVAGTC